MVAEVVYFNIPEVIVTGPEKLRQNLGYLMSWTGFKADTSRI